MAKLKNRPRRVVVFLLPIFRLSISFLVTFQKAQPKRMAKLKNRPRRVVVFLHLQCKYYRKP